MYLVLFIFFGGLCVAAALNLLLQRHPINSALSLIVVMSSLAVLYLLLGAEFLAAAQVIVYAGAIMVLFVFVVMLLNLGKATADQERRWLRPISWLGPGLLSLALLGELARVLLLSGNNGNPAGPTITAAAHAISASQVGVALFGAYLLAVELASMLLLAALIAALHLGRHE